MLLLIVFVCIINAQDSPSGSTGMTGASGSTGATGATGAMGPNTGMMAVDEPWYTIPLTAATGVSAPDPFYDGVSSAHSAPACLVDGDGKIYLRGQISVNQLHSQVQALALFPADNVGNCACMPPKDVIVTTSAVGGCIVRLILSPYMIGDLNHDHMTNTADRNIVTSSPFYSTNQSAPVACTMLQNGSISGSPTGYCGPADCNQDGQVDERDLVCVNSSATYGFSSPCGGITIIGTTCTTPINSISLDSIVYFSDLGIDGGAQPYFKKRKAHVKHETILQHMDKLEARIRELEMKK